MLSIKKKSNEDILKFFTPENIKNNYNKIECNSAPINPDIILIDNIKYDKNKIHLFSPEFLITNGLKSNIELCDLEMFNSDNYAVDIFAKYITQIISKINESINNNDFFTDFINNNLIKIYKLDFLHYISAKIDYTLISELESKENKDIKNDFIKLSIQSNNYHNQNEKSLSKVH